MIRKVQDDLIDEQFSLAVPAVGEGVGPYAVFYRENSIDVPGVGKELAKARMGKGLFGKSYKQLQDEGKNAEEETRKAITRSEITRAVRASFDLL